MKRNKSTLKRTGGSWDPEAWPRYFIAGSLSWVNVGATVARDVLIAVNELNSETQTKIVEGLLETGHNVLLDSGVYNLANEHAKTHNLSMNEALSLAPDEIDGFDALFERYVTLAHRLGDRLWGVVEIDQGGLHNKRRTRQRLEDLGIRPIPVYHPLNDGWDYFDELAREYDRLCFGNVVHADQAMRKRLVATAWQRRKQYPGLWIHLLGLTPYATTLAFPANSCDSSTWLGSLRWGAMPVWAATQDLWPTGDVFTYDKGVESMADRGSHRACLVSGYDAMFVGRCMRNILADQREQLGCDP